MLALLNEDKLKIFGLLWPLAARLFNDGTEAAFDRLFLLALGLVIAYAFGAHFARYTDRPIGPGIVPFILVFVILLPTPVSPTSAVISISFGSIFGREVFGGKPVLPPALIALAFAMFSYPDGGFQLQQISGHAIDPIFTVASLVGGVIYLWRDFLAWRVAIGAFLGSVLCSLLTHGYIAWEQPMLGTYIAGVLFLAASAESAPQSRNACWLIGVLVGLLVIILRATDPNQPDSVVFALLLGCLFAPLLDRLFLWRSQLG